MYPRQQDAYRCRATPCIVYFICVVFQQYEYVHQYAHQTTDRHISKYKSISMFIRASISMEEKWIWKWFQCKWNRILRWECCLLIVVWYDFQKHMQETTRLRSICENCGNVCLSEGRQWHIERARFGWLGLPILQSGGKFEWGNCSERAFSRSQIEQRDRDTIKQQSMPCWKLNSKYPQSWFLCWTVYSPNILRYILRIRAFRKYIW